MDFGVWFADELSHILQSLLDTGEDFAALADSGSNPQLVQAYQAGFQAALRSFARAIDIQPPKVRSRKAASAARKGVVQPIQPRPSHPDGRPRPHLPRS